VNMLDPAAVRSNSFRKERPPKSGRQVELPEVDRAEFFEVEAAKKKINLAQVAFVKEFESLMTRRR
jgi:predicted NUDIX family NTP pyrophosphohydrolase